MSWWSRHKNRVSLLLIVCICIGFLVTVGLMFLGPIIGDTFCTLAGCLGGISINLDGLPAGSEYEVHVLLPSGERIVQRCENTSEIIPFSQSCTKSGVYIPLEPDVIPPKELVVEIIVNGQNYSNEFIPQYEKFQPNGDNCAPICYSANIIFQIPR